MPRVPYVPEDTPGPIADEIRARRGGRGLSPLDTMLLNAPPIAEGWSKLLGAIRTKSTLEDDLREIIVSARFWTIASVLGQPPGARRSYG